MRSRFVQRTAYRPLAKTPLSKETTSIWTRSFITDRNIRRDTGKFLRAMDYHDTLRAAEVLRNFTKPVLVLWPRNNPLFPFSHAERWAKLLPGAQLVEVADSYTYLPIDQPAFTAEAIAAFIGQQAQNHDR
jgi:pimeloyl-ACP methyl ester carboxylesterase